MNMLYLPFAAQMKYCAGIMEQCCSKYYTILNYIHVTQHNTGVSSLLCNTDMYYTLYRQMLMYVLIFFAT